ncbi:MAG: AraC family transcriptional regulator, partial [Verrucomicrobia bacterium]|nr:AraC family transcriptional regulator [Verrucomicrobiota bacterium]
MEPMKLSQRERDAQREQCNREELVERMRRAIPTDGRTEPLKGLHLIRASTTTESMHGVAEPSFCVIAQGSKEICLGEERYQYDPYSYLLATMELPVVARVLGASEEQPYLAFSLALDP